MTSWGVRAECYGRADLGEYRLRALRTAAG
jgi:hypothetical protein